MKLLRKLLMFIMQGDGAHQSPLVIIHIVGEQVAALTHGLSMFVSGLVPHATIFLKVCIQGGLAILKIVGCCGTQQLAFFVGVED